jgi:hypothetical protein
MRGRVAGVLMRTVGGRVATATGVPPAGVGGAGVTGRVVGPVDSSVRAGLAVFARVHM